jgi:hypothetical protein
MIVFTFASPPLLVLKHDTPVDGGFVRSLFNLYYIVVMTLGAAGAAGCAYLGKYPQALAMIGVVVFVFLLRRWVLSKMDDLRDAITRGEPMAIRRFRRLHIGGTLFNVVQLGAVAWGLTRFVG